MKILHTSRRVVTPPTQVAELITKLLKTPTDDIPQALGDLDTWRWPRSDLNAWVKVLNKFDALLEEIIRDYDIEKLQVNDFTPLTKQIVCIVLRFTRLLMENSTNRKVFNSYDRLNILFYSSDLDVVILALNVLLRPSQQYSAQPTINNALKISTPRLESLAKRWPYLREYGIGLVDLAGSMGSPEIDGLPTEVREVNFGFYRTEVAVEGGQEQDMETDVFEAQATPRKANTSTTSSGSGAITIHIDEQKLASKSAMDVLADTLELYLVPEDQKFELLCRIRVASVLSKDREVDRAKLIIVRLLAIAIYGHTHSESVATTSLFLYEPDLIVHIAELLQIDRNIPIDVQTAALATLDSLGRYRNRNQEVLTAVNAGVNHGILMALVRKTVTDIADPDSTIPQSFIEAILSFVTLITSQASGANMVVGAGLIPLLIQMIDNKLPKRLLVVSKAMQLMDSVLYSFTNAFNMFCTSRGVEVLVDRIEHEVDCNIRDNGTASGVFGLRVDLPIARSSALKHLLRSMHRMMQSSGTAEGLRGLIDMSLLKSIKKIIENRGVFGSSVLPLAINIMATFVHNEPTSLAIIQEAGLPEAFYKTIESGLDPVIEVLQAIPNALGALCLNDVGQAQLARRPSIIPGLLSVFTSERHLKILLDRENAVLIGTAIDELIRHHPSLKAPVFDALKVTISKIEELGKNFEVSDDLWQWYFLTTVSPSNLDHDVPMDDVVTAITHPNTQIRPADGEQEPKNHDNHIVSFIDAFGRFLEGLFQHTPHCKDFINSNGLDYLGRLTSLPCLPYDFANGVSSDSMVQVMRTMTEVSATETLTHLSKLVKESLEDTRDFWGVSQEQSKLLPLVEITNEQQLYANQYFRRLVTLHIRTTLLSDTFATAGYAHGRAAFGLLQTLMNNMPLQVISDMGSLHRASVWENIALSNGLTSSKASPTNILSAPYLSESPADSVSMPPITEGTSNTSGLNGDLSPPEAEIATPASTSRRVASSTPRGPRERNSAALKHVTHGLPGALAPFFQAMVKMFYVRRPDSTQRKQITDSSKEVAKLMVDHLTYKHDGDLSSKYAYDTIMLGLYSLILIEERASTFSLHTVQLSALYRAGGLDVVLDVCRAFVNTIEALSIIKEEEREDNQKTELIHAYSGIKVAMQLLRTIISSKSLLESGQTSGIVTRDKKDTDPDYFEPHNFLVKLRFAVLPLLKNLWEAPWLISAPLHVSKSIVQAVLELTNGESEDSKGETSIVEILSASGGGIVRPPGPDEGRVHILMDMGFPRSAAERALSRTHNNLNAATELLLAHPYPLPPDPEPEQSSPAESTAQDSVIETEPGEQPVTGATSRQGPAEIIGPSIEADASLPDSVETITSQKSAEQWKKDLDNAREPLRAGLSRQALLLIDEHVSLLFDLHVVFLRPDTSHREQAVQDLVDDIKGFSPSAYDIQEQPLANRCRLLALVLSESPSLLSQEVRATLMDSLLALLLSTINLEHPPRWLAAHLLVTEALFTLSAEPRSITLPKENEAIVPETISVGPPLLEAKDIVFDFCLRLLAVQNLPPDELLSTLRLFVFLTRDPKMGSQFVRGGGVSLLLKRVKASAVASSSSYIATILRHVVEDTQTIRSVMQQTIKRTLSQNRGRGLVDLIEYVRGCSAAALRDPEIFLEATASLCQLGQPFSSPHISLKPESSSTTEESAHLPMGSAVEMQVDQIAPATTPIIPNESTDNIIHHVITELMNSAKTMNEMLLQPPVTAGTVSGGDAEHSNDIETTATAGGSTPLHSAGLAGLHDYMCFLMQCLTELLFSYDACKLAFLSYSPKKRTQTPAKDSGSRYRNATLQFLLMDFITFGTISHLTDEKARNRTTLCHLAMSVLVALCIDTTPNHEVKEVSPELASVRKFVLEAVSRSIKELPSFETVDARYGRLLALTDLCHRLLTVKINSASRKQYEENPTHIAKVMLEKGFVATLTTALSEIDLNYPNIRNLVPSILRPLEFLTRIAIKMSRSSGKNKESVEGFKTESISSLSSEEEDSDMEEDPGREETPDLYRNSALGMYGGEMDDGHFGEDDMDEDDEDEDEDVEMDFGEETGSEDTSNTEDDVGDDGLDDETRDSRDTWDEDEDEDERLVENEHEDNREGHHDLDDGDEDDEEMLWQDIRGDIDEVRMLAEDMDDDDEHGVPIQVVHEPDDEADEVGSDEDDFIVENGAFTGEEIFDFEGFINNNNDRESGGVFVQRQRRRVDDGAQMFGRPRTNAATPPDATTHPLLVDTSSTVTRAPVSQSRGARQTRNGGPMGVVQTIEDLISGGAVQLFTQVMTTRGGGDGPETIRLEVTPRNTNLERGFVQPRRGAPVYATQIRVEGPPSPPTESHGRELEPLSTSQRWAQEIKILHGDFIAERLKRLANHVALTLLPAAVEAIKEEKIREAEDLARREAKAKAEAQAEEEAQATTTSTTTEGMGNRTEEQSLSAMSSASLEEGKSPPSSPIGSSGATAQDRTMEDATPIEADSDMADPAIARDGQSSDAVIPMQVSDPAVGAPAESSSATPAVVERVTVMIHGSAVDITETGIDPTFLEALPDDMREEVLNQHVRDQRAARVERPPDSQISSEFLDALPPEIRAEIIQQEAVQRARAVPGVPAEIDNASFIASLDPTLRQTVLMEQDEGFIQTLPSHMLAEVGEYREGHQSRRMMQPRLTTRPVTTASLGARKFIPQHDAIQLLDKFGVAVLVRLLFFPHVLKKVLLFKVLVNLCENAKTRTELFNLLLNILQDGTGDLAAVDKSFAQMSFRNTKPQTPKSVGKQKSGPEFLTSLALPNAQNEVVPDLIAQRCLEGLTYIVSSNEPSSLFFLTEHELPVGLRRNTSKKGKGKEKQVPQTHYPIVLLLGLLDRESLLRTPTIMESVVSLLATVTRPLASLKDRKKVSVEGPSNTSSDPAQVPPEENSITAPGAIVAEPEPAIETSSSLIVENPPTASGPAEQADATPEPLTSGINSDPLSIEGMEEKILLANPPQIPHAVLRLIVNILTVGECSGRTFQQSLALIQNLSYIPDARDIVAQELKSKAQDFGQSLSSDLDELATALGGSQGDLLVSSVASRFSPASSAQAKLLRVLKTIDYMYSPKSTPPSDSDNNEDVEKVQAIYGSFQFSVLWRRLGDCLSIIEEKPATEHIATVLLPLIEALMVVCKYVGSKGSTSSIFRILRASSPKSPTTPRESMEDLFVTFTDSHRKVLNLMVRNNPSLMSGSFSLLVHNPRVLDFDNKRNYFNQQLHRRPHAREHHSTLQLNVRRARVFEDSFQHLQRKTGEQIKYGKLSVRFYDEEGVDAGGVTREWFQILARQMFDPNNALFQPCAADKLTYQPNKNSWVNPEHLTFFKFVGRVIGKAIYDGRLLDAYFARSLYRQLLGKPVDYKDVEWVDPEYYNSLCWILENDPTALDLTFSVEADEFGVNRIVPLKEGGETLPVTQENKREFVQLSAQYRLHSSIKNQIESLSNGFYEIIPKDLITIFNEQELELLISGTPDIDVDEWRAATEYSGYNSSDPNIVWWWRALKSFNRDERAKVLSFATGTSRVPLSGFVDLQGVQGVQRFSIHKAYGASDRLPQAHTCFNQIDLPQYTSYEMLRQQLLLAINEGGEGFAFS
ncbi:hypothetical protein BDZ94DRAFT_1323842 [Collybia nuda]|uniref:HECT-type E3 ubiquitin transferase n=1 Tax=Collybia nuda TaxID=64659 RepID=A0A9P5Y1P6_9AGAR|nr:hypothetical protein BDZ94DRAFT_1323842 [Collybia nuda]